MGLYRERNKARGIPDSTIICLGAVRLLSAFPKLSCVEGGIVGRRERGSEGRDRNTDRIDRRCHVEIENPTVSRPAGVKKQRNQTRKKVDGSKILSRIVDNVTTELSKSFLECKKAS